LLFDWRGRGRRRQVVSRGVHSTARRRVTRDGIVATTAALVMRLQLIGDDLFATNPDRLEEGIHRAARPPTSCRSS
jgi:hypothetical protein